MKVHYRILLIAFLIGAGIASAGVTSCGIYTPAGDYATWINLANGQADGTYWMKASGTLNTSLKFVVKFNPSSGFYRYIYKMPNFSTTYSEVNRPLQVGWMDDSVVGPAHMTAKGVDSKCNFDFEIVKSAFESTNVPAAIPDASSTDSTVVVSGIGTIQRVRVSFWIKHPQDDNLDVSLVGPDGTTVVLTSDNGGIGANYGNSCYSRTVLDSDAIVPISSVSAPFRGVYQPEQSLTAFAGKSGISANGTWTLHVADDTGGAVGEIECWSLSIDDVP